MKKNKKFFIYSKTLAASGSFRARPQAVFPRLLSLSAPKYPFLTAKERFLTGRTIKKTYQIKLKRCFGRSGTYFARLINNPAGGRVVSGKAFPQIKSYQLTYQSGSNYSAITARQYLDCLKIQGNLLFESNLTSNNRQQQSNHHHAERDLGQNNSISQINHNASNNFSVFTANNQLNITSNPLIVKTKRSFVTNIDPNQKTTKSEKTDEATFKLAEDIFINSIYHHPCN